MTEKDSSKDIQSQITSVISDAVNSRDVLGKNNKLVNYVTAEEICMPRFPQLEVLYSEILFKSIAMHVYG